MKKSRIPVRKIESNKIMTLSDIETTSLDQISIDDDEDSETSDTVSAEKINNKQMKNRVKVIPIQVKPQIEPSETSTTSTIEELLAEKVERIASHLEMANSNILSVGGKLNGIRDDTVEKF